MKWLNYNHLYYFWVVAREGGVVRAGEELMVSQPTISTQLRDLERALGHRLFDRAGRGLVLTEVGRMAFNYANEIFTLGQEMINALEHQPAARPLRLAVGLVDVIPKLVALRLLEPAMKLESPVRLICREDKADRLLADLAARRVDVVLSDAPIGTAVQLQAFNHLLGESEVAQRRAHAAADRAHRATSLAEQLVRLEAHPPRRQRRVRRQRAAVPLRPERRRHLPGADDRRSPGAAHVQRATRRARPRRARA